MIATRRGFIGSMLAAPVAVAAVVGAYGEGEQAEGSRVALADFNPPKEEVEVDLRTDDGARQWATWTPTRFARVVFRELDRRIGAGKHVVGPVNAQMGATWGSGHFTHQVYAVLPNMPDQLVFDRLYLMDVVEKLAEKIEARKLVYFGRMVLVQGLSHASTVENSRLSLRFVQHWDIHHDTLVGRFDLLGGTAV